MKNYSIEDFYTLDFEITSIFAQRQKWIDGALFERRKPRESGAFIFLNGCTGQYTDFLTQKSFFAPLKSLVYLPYHGTYSVLNMESGKSGVDAYLVEFNMVSQGRVLSPSDAPVMIEGFNPYYIEKIMSEIINHYESAKSSPSALKSRIYELITYVSSLSAVVEDQIPQPIKQALEHIEKNPFDGYQIEELAAMCAMSSGGFRRLFKQHLGKSPKEYILEIKIGTAKTLLEESKMTVQEISKALNFETSSYFCRFFKNKTALSPSEYRAKSRNNC